MYYLYNNSPAFAPQGFIHRKSSIRWPKTTMEFAFAMEFDTMEEATTYNRRHRHQCIIFRKVDEP